CSSARSAGIATAGAASCSVSTSAARAPDNATSSFRSTRRTDQTESAMGVRTGAEYLEGLRDARDVWLRGERVRDVTSHPGLARGAATMAALLDRQHDPALRDRLTVAGDDGGRYATSFLRPTTAGELRQRSVAMYDWALQSGGMLGRTGDYLNASVMA